MSCPGRITVAVLLAVCAACNESTSPGIVPLRLAIGGSPAELEKGTSVQLSTTVTTPQNPASIIWQTSNARVITITSSGLATALDTGTAVIRASIAGTAARDSATIPVVFVSSKVREQSTRLRVLIPGTLTTVNPAQVSGIVDATFDWSLPGGVTFTSARITWNGATLCATSVTAQQGEWVCEFDTRKLSNGTGAIRGEMLNSNNVIASATYPTLTIAN